MKRFLVCLLFASVCLPLQAQMSPEEKLPREITLKREIRFSVPELSIRDSVFMGSLFETLQSSARSRPREFEEYEYFRMDISKGEDSEIKIDVGSVPELRDFKGFGYFIYNEKIFFVRGNLADQFFSQETRKRRFSTVYLFSIDDRFLQWNIDYRAGVWDLRFYPDKFDTVYSREKVTYEYLPLDSVVKEKVPLLISTSVKAYIRSALVRAEIPCRCVRDTVKLSLSVFVRFDNEIRDTTKALRPVEMYLERMSYNPGSGDQIDLFSSSETTPYDRCLWDTCSAKLMEWMKHQPYSNSYGREYERKGVMSSTFSCIVLLIPE